MKIIVLYTYFQLPLILYKKYLDNYHMYAYICTGKQRTIHTKETEIVYTDEALKSNGQRKKRTETLFWKKLYTGNTIFFYHTVSFCETGRIKLIATVWQNNITNKVLLPLTKETSHAAWNIRYFHITAIYCPPLSIKLAITYPKQTNI